MVRDDFLSSLTQEIRDEAIERYITERRLIELQIEDLQPQALKARACALQTSKRLMRLGFWLIAGDIREDFLSLINLPADSPWRQYLEGESAYGLHSVQVSALRDWVRLRKILIKAYARAHSWAQSYIREYRELEAQCAAVNANIKAFQNNSELLTVLGFLKSLDIRGIERSHFLGGNFTAAELTSVDEKLSFHPVSMASFEVTPPLALPQPNSLAPCLETLADRIYDHYHDAVKHLLQAAGKHGY